MLSAAAMSALPEPAGERPTAPEARAEVAADLLADPRAIWPPQPGGRPGLFIMGGRTQSLLPPPIPVSPGYFVPAAQTIFNLYPLPWRHREAGGCQEQAPVQLSAAGSCFPRSRRRAAVLGEAGAFRPRPRALPGVPGGVWPPPGVPGGVWPLPGVRPLPCKPHDRRAGGAGSRLCLPVPSRGHSGARRPRALRSPAKAEMKASSANAPGVCLAPVSSFLLRSLSPVRAGGGVGVSRRAELSLGSRVDPGPRADSGPSRARPLLEASPGCGAVAAARSPHPPAPTEGTQETSAPRSAASSGGGTARAGPGGLLSLPFLILPLFPPFPPSSLSPSFPWPPLGGATPRARSAECILLLNQAWIFKA